LVWWGSAYGATGGPTAAAEASLAFALASLVQPVLVFCPTPVRALTAVAIILASSACLMIQAKHTAQVDAETEEAAREERAWEESVRNHFDMLASDIRLEESQYTTPKEEPIPELPLHNSLRSRFTEDLDAFFFRLLLSSLIIGICTSVLQGFVEPADIATYDVAYAMSICFSSLAASALVFLTLLLSKRLDFAFSYQPVLPLAILGCSAILFLQESSIITLTLLLINYQYFTLINWVILASYSYNASMSAAHIFGWGRASLSGGILLGHLILFYTGNIGDYSFTEMTAVSFSIILVLSLTCSFLYTSRTLAQTLRRQWLSLPPRKSSLDHSLDNEIELTFEEKVDLTAQKYNITGRMYEVFVLLANGRSGTRIEQELYMAKGTVKTHTSRIYKKLDVHSKQQLLDLIETACKE
jgi:DNA-binding CsgD family transcriptional regulator